MLKQLIFGSLSLVAIFFSELSSAEFSHGKLEISRSLRMIKTDMLVPPLHEYDQWRIYFARGENAKETDAYYHHFLSFSSDQDYSEHQKVSAFESDHVNTTKFEDGLLSRPVASFLIGGSHVLI